MAGCMQQGSDGREDSSAFVLQRIATRLWTKNMPDEWRFTFIHSLKKMFSFTGIIFVTQMKILVWCHFNFHFPPLV